MKTINEALAEYCFTDNAKVKAKLSNEHGELRKNIIFIFKGCTANRCFIQGHKALKAVEILGGSSHLVEFIGEYGYTTYQYIFNEDYLKAYADILETKGYEVYYLDLSV